MLLMDLGDAFEATFFSAVAYVLLLISLILLFVPKVPGWFCLAAFTLTVLAGFPPAAIAINRYRDQHIWTQASTLFALPLASVLVIAVITGASKRSQYTPIDRPGNALIEEPSVGVPGDDPGDDANDQVDQ